jgi:hypothetical protein
MNRPSSKISAGVSSALLAAGVLGGASLAAAPAGNATCMSVGGKNNTDQCVSGPDSIAIAIGKAAIAQASGHFSIAIANGTGVADPGTCSVGGSGEGCVRAATGNQIPGARGNFSLAFAGGADGKPAGAIVEADKSVAIALGGNTAAGALGDSFNVAVDISQNTGGGKSEATVWSGKNNFATNIGGGSDGPADVLLSWVNGSNSIASNIGTRGNGTAQVGKVQLASDPDTEMAAAFSWFGKNNKVRAEGRTAIAGAVNQNDATVTQVGPGTNIKGLPLPGAGRKPASARAPKPAEARSAKRAAAGD